LSVYAFSTENWKRDPDEVGGLMRLLEETIRRETPTLAKDGVRLRIIGRLQELSDGVRRAMDEAAHATDTGKNGTMTIAFNYGGRAEIVDAVKRLVSEGVPADRVDEQAIATRLYAPEHPDPDLHHPHRRRAAGLELPALGGRVRRDVGDRCALARLRGRAPRPGARRGAAGQGPGHAQERHRTLDRAQG